MSLPNIRVVIREAADQNLTVDVPNVAVTVQQDSQYNVNIIPNSTVTLRTGSFVTYADLSALAFTASYALAAEAAVGSIQSASYAVYADSAGTATSASHAIYADTAGYAPSEWNAVANKPAGIVSSSTQVDYTQIQNQPTLIQSSSYAANADLFDGRNSTTFAGTGSNTFIGTQTISGSLLVSGALSTLDYVDLVLDGNPTHVEGRIFYNIDDHAVTYYNEATDVAIQLGQEQVLRARNQTGQPILNGTPVRIIGAQGNRPTIEPSISEIHAAAADNFDEVVGVATHDIPHNTDGYVTTQGIVRGIDLSDFTAGDILYVNTGSGGFTNILPPAPYDVMPAGIVIVAGNNGQLFVKPRQPLHLHDLSGVSNDAPEQGDLLVFQSSSLVWEKRSTNINISGSFYGTASYATSASYAMSASRAITSSFATSASYAPTILPAGTVSSSAQASSWTVATASVATSASYAVTASYVSGAASTWDTITNKPAGLVSSSTQVDYTQIQNQPTTIPTASYVNPLQQLLVVTGSIDVAQGNINLENNSYFLHGTSTGNSLVSLIGVSNADIVQVGNQGYDIELMDNTKVRGELSASIAKLTSITGSLLGTASRAIVADSVEWTSVSNKPSGLVSSSQQINTGSFTGSFAGIFSGDGSGLTNLQLPPSTGSTIYVLDDGAGEFVTSRLDFGTFISATNSSGTASINVNLPAGTVSSSTQITLTDTIGNLSGSRIISIVPSSSYAITSSYAETAQSVLGTVTSASYAVTASYVSGAASTWDDISGKPAGLVSSSQQINTGSFSGSFTGALTGTASWASNVVTASYANTAATASYISGGVSFPNGLDVTGSIVATSGFTGSLQGTASYAELLVPYTLSVSTPITQQFNVITSGSQHITDGIYSIASTLSGSVLNNYKISGMFAWATGVADGTSTDEIFLHRLGTTTTTASIFMRTRTVSESVAFLEIGADTTIDTGSFTFTFIKMA